ncbi:MAG: hypothetical protein GX846_05835, partial [Deltaproteobacteria bacterium]|nr:hypothetical protein [Deltaproteobacteria bacterium]
GNMFEILEGNIVKDPRPEKILNVWKERVVLTDRYFGIAMAIDTYPDTATAIVLLATKEEVNTGAYLKSISWTDTPDYISAKANCPVK